MPLFGPLQEIATILAIETIASGIEEFEFHWDEDWDLTAEQWIAVCNEAERLKPIIKVPDAARAEWAAVNRGFRAEQAAENRSVFGGEF